jgi:predicted ATPase
MYRTVKSVTVQKVLSVAAAQELRLTYSQGMSLSELKREQRQRTRSLWQRVQCVHLCGYAHHIIGEAVLATVNERVTRILVQLAESSIVI